MFEATLQAADPDRERIQRLLLASALAIGATTAALAISWTLERFGIERVGAPRAEPLELAMFSLLPPPTPDPPPPPDDATKADAGGPSEPGPRLDSLVENIEDVIGDTPQPSRRIPDIGSPGKGGSTIPGIGGCPAGICGGGPPGIGGPGGGGNCVGPHCGVAKRPDAPPTQVQFSALHCIACADPDQAQLRRTSSSLRRRGGQVQVQFCVDPRGHIESDSLRIAKSFGDVEVNRVVKAAVARWRFEPMKVAGQPRRACSVARFEISFE